MNRRTHDALCDPSQLNACRVSLSPLQHPLVTGLAEKYEKDAGQVGRIQVRRSNDIGQFPPYHFALHANQILIRWAVQRGVSVLPKSVHPDRIRSNIAVIDWELEQEDFQALSSFKEQVRRSPSPSLLVSKANN